MASSRQLPEALALAVDVNDLHPDHFQLLLAAEHELYRRLDLVLGRVLGDTEHVLIALVGEKRAFLGNYRRQHHLHQAQLLAGAGCGAHASISSIFATAPFVINTFAWRMRLRGSAPPAVTT